MEKMIFLESVVKMPLMDLPVKSTCIQLQEGRVLISPGSNLAKDQLAPLNNLTDLIAPSLFHCAGVQKIRPIFPTARIWGVEGAKELKPDVGWTDKLTPQSWKFQDELPMIQLGGIPKVNEVVFFHKESKSLIVADLCFNLVDASGFGSWLILNLFGTYRKFAISHFFTRFIADRKAFEKSLSQIFELDFENLILSHGANVNGNAKEKLLSALRERGLGPR